MDRIRSTWLGEFKSVIFLALGIIGVFKIPNMMPFLVFLFIVLFGMIALFRIVEVYLLKKKENTTNNLIAGAINLLFVVWSVMELMKYSVDNYRGFADNVFVIISAWIALLVLWGLFEGVKLLIQKNIIGNIVLAEAILSALLWFFFYRVTLAIKEDVLNDKVIVNFGIFCISLALISFFNSKVVKYLVARYKSEN